MIHRYLINVQVFDAIFVSALAMAAYHHVGYVWLLYVIYPMLAVSIFRIIKDMSSWFYHIADQLVYIGRCIRDKTEINVEVNRHNNP